VSRPRRHRGPRRGVHRRAGGWIPESRYHSDGDSEESRYFMRIDIKADSLPFCLAEFRERFRPLAEELGMTWKIGDSAQKKRVVILVSRQEHYLYDILARWQSKELDVEIPCIVSNHDTFRGFVEWHGIPFHHVPVHTMALARYMQVLPADICAAYPGCILNIHHSFLPSFEGARPYHPTYRRGVKLTGATCHYVTRDLDQGRSSSRT
jgi:formyltetrahydrofolate deformylase